jgi:hypothetical protein
MKDPQSVFYALDIMLRHNLDALWCRWVYYLTDVKAHPQATHVDVELKREDVLKAAYEWLLVAVEMRELVRAAIAGTLSLDDIAPASVLPPHPDSPCSSYGGCPYSISKGGPCAPAGEVQLGSLFLTQNKKEDTMGLQETFNQTQAALAGTGPMLPPGANPLVPPEATTAPALPPGFENGPFGMRAIAPAGYQYNAANALELIPPPPPAVTVAGPTILNTPPAGPPNLPPPIPEQPAPEAGKAKGRQKASKSKVEDIIDLLLAAHKNGRADLGTLTVAQLTAISDAVEAA